MFTKDQKIFISYAFTGEPEGEVRTRNKRICDAISASGAIPYCNMFDDMTAEFSTPGQYVTDAVERVKECDGFIMLKTNSNRSEGQYTEFGAALACDMPRVLLLHESAVDSTYLNDPLLMDNTLMWSSEEELLGIVKGLVS